MKQTHSSTLDAALRAQRFLDANAAALGTVNQSTSRADLDNGILGLQGHATAQGTGIIGSRGETRNQKALRLLIRKKYMQPISEIAAGKLADVPQFADLRLPLGNVVGNRFIAAAEAMAAAALPYIKVFTDAALPASILDDFHADVTRLQQSIGVRTDHSRNRSTASKGLNAAAAQVRAAIRVLDGAVRHQLVGNTTLLSVWSAEKRVKGKRASAVTPAPQTPVTPSAPPAAATTAPAAPAAPAAQGGQATAA